MGNPVLSEKVFKTASATAYEDSMTVKGTALKSLILVFMVLAGASYTWKVFNDTLNPGISYTMDVGRYNWWPYNSPDY